MKLLQRILLLTMVTKCLTLPAGCTYDSTEILYTCSARSWSPPMAYADFNSGVPQRIMIKDMAGTLAANTFSGFGSINTGVFDSRYVPSLHVICFAHADVVLETGVFTDFGFIDEFKIIDCGILSVPVNIFAPLGDVNLFHIIGGSITNILADGFSGLNVKKMTQYPNPLGEFGIINSQVVGSSLTAGALYGLVNLEILRLESAHLLVTQVDMFTRLTNVKKLILNHNAFTKIYSGMFSGLNALEEIEIHGISWYCTCDYLWFLEYAKENNITLRGDYVCSAPAGQENKRLSTYYQETCVEVDLCEGEIGFALGGSCMTLTLILTYSLTLIVIIVSCVAFGMVIHYYRKVKASGLLDKADDKMNRKMSGSNLTKLDEEDATDGRRKSKTAIPNKNRTRRVSDDRATSVQGERRISQDIVRSPRQDPSIHAFEF